MHRSESDELLAEGRREGPGADIGVLVADHEKQTRWIGALRKELAFAQRLLSVRGKNVVLAGARMAR